MQIRSHGGWIAIDPHQAVDAIEAGYPVRLTDTNWLLAESWRTE